MERTIALEQAPALAERASSMLPAAAGIFLGSLVFDAIPMATAAVGLYAWAWALGGFAVMFVSSRLAGTQRLGRMALIASAGVWLHSLLEEPQPAQAARRRWAEQSWWQSGSLFT